MEAAVKLIADWCRAQPIPGMRVDVRRLPGLTPLLLVDVPGELAGSVLLYGHLDKQPEFTGWEPELGPWSPVIRDGKLYGRGGADDGYAVFSSLAAILALEVDDVRQVAVAGDTANDLLAGTRAGASIVAGVLTGAHDRATLAAAPHTHVLDSVVDLPPLCVE